MYLIGKLHLESGPLPEQVGVGRLLFATLFFGTSLYMIPGLLGAPLNGLDAFLPPRQGTDVSLLAALPAGARADLNEGWIIDDIDAALAQARAEERPVFIDFTGYTCTNCRSMESNVFPRPTVARQLERFVLLRLYTDDLENGEALAQYQLKLTASTALPTYAVVDPEGRLITKESGMMGVEAFADFLGRGASRYEQNLAAR
jgi:thiol:disulfide interchange protein DsbD